MNLSLPTYSINSSKGRSRTIWLTGSLCILRKWTANRRRGQFWPTSIVGASKVYLDFFKHWSACYTRIAVVPPFSGIRNFPQGRGFKQWTGDDSKALMKARWLLVHTHITGRLNTIPGLSSRYWMSCPSWHSTVSTSVSWVLLYCTPWYHYRGIIDTAQGSSQTLPSLPSDIWWHWHISWIISSPTTFDGSLRRQHTSFRRAKWTLLFNHGIET